MAYISSPSASFGEKALASLSNGFESVLRFLADLSNAQSRMDMIERMQRMSDEDLMSKYRIERKDIVQHVFRDKMMF
ncbi:MAG: hypothetical protein AAF393_16330 [Pseudomonadota bacterium]